MADEAAGDLLHNFSRSLVDGKFNLFRSVFRLPYLIEVSGTARIISSEGEMERTYNAVRAYYERHDLRDVVSTIHTVEHLSSARLGITGLIALMQADGVRFKSPFPVYLIADRANGAWRISCSIYAVIDDPDLAAALRARERD